MEYHDGTYVLTNPISEKNIKEMRNNMDDSDVTEFDKFLERNWGIKMKRYDDDFVEDSLENSLEEKKVSKRGRKPKAVK